MKFLCGLSYFLCIFYYYNVKAQTTPYKKTQFIWETNLAEKIEPEAQFKEEDAIILYEKTVAKLPSVENTSTLLLNKNFYITKTIRVLLKTQKAVDDFSSIYLPESADKLIDADNKKFCYFFLDWYNIIDDYRVMAFAARVFNKDGSFSNIEISDKNEVDSIYNTILTFPRIRTHFQIGKLKIGDELQLAYKLEIPIQSNLNYRFFFNEIYPIQNYELSLSFPAWISTQIDLVNGAETNFDSTHIIENKMEKVSYHWKRKNLQGYIYSSTYANFNSIPSVEIELFSGVYVTPIGFSAGTLNLNLVSHRLSRNSKKLDLYNYEFNYNNEREKI